MAHVINLVVQDILQNINLVPSEESLSMDGEDEAEDSEIQGDRLSDIASKLRRLIVKLRSSPQRREKFERQCEVANIPPKRVLLDVKTRWNSTYDMFERALELREVWSGPIETL